MQWPERQSEQAAMRRLLIQLRRDAGVSQNTLAERLRITQSNVSKFERGERRLDEQRLRAWLQALGIEWASFVDAFDEALGRLDACME